MLRTEKIVSAWVTGILNHPKLSILANLLVCCLFLTGLSNFGLNSSPRDFLGQGAPLVKHLIELEAEYMEDTNILLMFKPKQGTIFNQTVLSAIEGATSLAWQLPYSIRVDSLTNFQHTHAEGDELIVADLVQNAPELSQDEINKIQTIALQDPRLVKLLVAKDGKAAGINILLSIDLGNNEQVGDVYTALSKLKQTIKQNHPNIDIYETGFAVLTEHWKQGATQDIKRVWTISLTIIALGLIYFFGNLRAALAVMLTGALPVAVGLGVLGLFNTVLNPASILATLMVLVLGLADGIHVTKSVRRLLAQGKSNKQAIIDSVVTNFTPMALTSITTAIGFLTFNLAGYEGIKIMGNYVALGVILAFLLSVLLLPPLLCYCGLRKEPQKGGNNRHVLFADFIIRHHKLFLLLTAPTVVISIFCINLLEIDDRVTRYLKDSQPFTQHLDQIQQDLTGMSSMVYNFNSGEAGGVSNPEFIRKVDEFSQMVAQQENVRHVNTFTSTLKELNKNLHGGNQSYYQLPVDKELAAQYLLLYEMSLPYGLGLTNQINLDKSGTRVLVTTNDMSISKTKVLIEHNNKWLAKNAPNFDTQANSNTLSTLLMSEEATLILLSSGIIALMIIGAILLFTFNSFYAGLLCVISVLSPILVSYGIWGIVIGTLGLPTALAICMVIGTAVDFSVHFISKYTYARRQLKQEVDDSIRYAFKLVSAPIITSVVVLGGGFAVLALSVFQYSSVMGSITAMCIFFGALSTFLLIPSLLLTGKFPIK